jgi:hypothetical protein
VRRKSWAQKSRIEAQPRKRCIVSKVLWYLARIVGYARMRIARRRINEVHATNTPV